MPPIPPGSNPDNQYKFNFADTLTMPLQNYNNKQETVIRAASPESRIFSSPRTTASINTQNPKDIQSFDFSEFDNSDAGKYFGVIADRSMKPVFTSVLKTLGKAYGEKLGKEGMQIILKNFSKMIPLVGAATSAKAAVEMFELSQNAVAPEARFLAGYGAALNTADAALSAVEPFIAGFGAPVALDIALGLGEMILELEVAAIEKDAANGTYVPTSGQHAAIGAIALSTPFVGIPKLINDFGYSGSAKILGTTLKEGAKMLLPLINKNYFPNQPAAKLDTAK